MITIKVCQKSLRSALKMGGFTSGDSKRYVWSTYGNERNIGNVAQGYEYLRDQMFAFRHMIPDDKLWGLWINPQGDVILDINESSDDLTAAVKEAIRNRQAAIWDSELQVDHTVLSALSLLVAAHADKAMTLASLLDDSK